MMKFYQSKVITVMMLTVASSGTAALSSVAPMCKALLVSNVASSGTNVAWPKGALTLDPDSSHGMINFNVTQKWKSSDPVSWWNIMQDTNFDGTWDSCVKRESVPANAVNHYAVACPPDGGEVTVQITLQDGSFSSSYNEDNSGDVCDGWPNGDGVAIYTLKFSCGCAETAPVAPFPGNVRASLAPAPKNSFAKCIHGTPGAHVCPDDVVLLNKPTTALPAGVMSPITILKQEGGNVTFNISNPYLSDVQTMYYEFYDELVHGGQCFAKANFASCGAPVTVTAPCARGRLADHSLSNAHTVVSLWIVDSMVIDDGGEIPQCCQPTPQDKNSNTVMYTYKVYCESECSADLSSNRYLRGGHP